MCLLLINLLFQAGSMGVTSSWCFLVTSAECMFLLMAKTPEDTATMDSPRSSSYETWWNQHLKIWWLRGKFWSMVHYLGENSSHFLGLCIYFHFYFFFCRVDYNSTERISKEIIVRCGRWRDHGYIHSHQMEAENLSYQIMTPDRKSLRAIFKYRFAARSKVWISSWILSWISSWL